LVAWRLGESSQQPTWPHVRQSRRCTHQDPVLRHSSQPSALGVTSTMEWKCGQGSAIGAAYPSPLWRQRPVRAARMKYPSFITLTPSDRLSQPGAAEGEKTKKHQKRTIGSGPCGWSVGGETWPTEAWPRRSLPVPTKSEKEPKTPTGAPQSPTRHAVEILNAGICPSRPRTLFHWFWPAVRAHCAYTFCSTLSRTVRMAACGR